MEITLGTNLVICERPTFPALHPLFDLTEDLSVARLVIAAAERFFCLHVQSVVLSGYARKHDAYDGAPGDTGPAFYVQVWYQGEVYRTVAFSHLGYTGVLHVEIPKGKEPKDVIDADMIGDMCNGHEALRDEGIAEKCVGYVGNGKLAITVPQSYESH